MRKGISLVALVITIIVLIILVGVVIITGVNSPKGAQLAVFYNNVTNVQDAVTLKIMENVTKNAQKEDIELYKWVGVVNGYTEEMAISKTEPTFIEKEINGVSTAKLDVTLKSSMKISEEEFNKYYVDNKGVVYHEGFVYEGNTYYNRNNNTVIPEQPVVTLPEWITSTSLNSTTPYIEEEINGIKYYAPIPKGFTASKATTEKTISGGLVIYEGNVDVTDANVVTEKTTRNQFVWVPVNASYNMTSMASETAMQYWENRQAGVGTEGNGYNEPYPRTAGSWTKTEWDAMHASVMKYGGFYIGRYETGNAGGTAVVKHGQTVWNSIMWGPDMTTEPTGEYAVSLSRNMYRNNSTYGVTSTLIYSIQWDSVANWANCANESGKHGLSTTGAVENDKYNNVYDLRSNVVEWSMEAVNNVNRTHRGGNYNYQDTVSYHTSSITGGSGMTLGFRVSLYIN